MRKKRINGALASIPIQNGQVLKGEHLAILREVLSTAINENKYDIDRIVTSQDAVHIYGDNVEALNDYASTNPVDDETLGYLYTENQILLYKYLGNTNEWLYLGVLNLTELFNKIQELESRPGGSENELDLSDYLKRDGSLPMTGDLDMGDKQIDNVEAIDFTSGGRIVDGAISTSKNQVVIYSELNLNQRKVVGLKDPTNEQDAANKRWVEQSISNMFKDVNYNNANGVLTFTKYDDTTKEINLSLEVLVESGYYDEANNEIVLVMTNSNEIRIPVGDLFTDLDANNITFNGSGTNYLTTKTEVESAIKELDTKVKANADNVALKVVSVNTKQGVVVLNQDDIGDGETYKRVTDAEKSAWNLKQDKLVPGDNISIIDNVISASGGGGIPDAPSNNKLYGRKNNTWEEIEGGTGAGISIVNGAPISTPGSSGTIPTTYREGFGIQINVSGTGITGNRINKMLYDSTTAAINYSYGGATKVINLNITKNAEGFSINGTWSSGTGTPPSITFTISSVKANL